MGLRPRNLGKGKRCVPARTTILDGAIRIAVDDVTAIIIRSVIPSRLQLCIRLLNQRSPVPYRAIICYPRLIDINQTVIYSDPFFTAIDVEPDTIRAVTIVSNHRLNHRLITLSNLPQRCKKIAIANVALIDTANTWAIRSKKRLSTRLINGIAIDWRSGQIGAQIPLPDQLIQLGYGGADTQIAEGGGSGGSAGPCGVGKASIHQLIGDADHIG